MKDIAKKIIQKFFNLFGIQISLLPKPPRHEDVITGKVGNFELMMNADHTIIENIAHYPSYCANLPRLAQYVIKKYPEMNIIDIGANIGDGVALVRTQIHCPIICIEGDPEYFALLQKNLQQFRETDAFNVFLGEKESHMRVGTAKQGGTLQIKNPDQTSTTANGAALEIMTLDSLAQTQQQKFSRAKILKIDTDGYDLKIIRGSINFLKQNKPVIFFEYDRSYLDAVNDDGLSIFNAIKELNYHSILFYDNYGRFLISTTLDQTEKIAQLDAYISQKKGAFPYYDLCVFHKTDDDIACQLINAELALNK